MGERRDATRTVLESIENDDGSRCVDLFMRPDGTWGFEEFRRDAEDGGRWTAVARYGGTTFTARAEALAAALEHVRWLAGVATSRRSPNRP